MTTYVVSSDSDVPLELASLDKRKRAEECRPDDGSTFLAEPESNFQLSPEASPDSALVEQDEDPDWVKEFTPVRNRSLSGTIRPADRLSRSLECQSGNPAISGSLGEDENDLAMKIDDDDDDDLSEENVLAPTSKMEEICEKAEDSAATPKKPKPGSNSTARPKSDMPLVTGPKFEQNLLLIQAPENSFDLSGDVGAVGRVKVDHSGAFLDVKGLIYSCGVQDINAVCVVSVGDEEARITAILDEAVTLYEDKTFFGSREHLVSGVLDEDELADNSQVQDSKCADLASSANVARKAAKASRASKGKAKSKTKPPARARPRAKKSKK